MAKKINAKMLLADMSAGMSKQALMSKYGLSATQFESAMRKLNEAGYSTGYQVSKPADPTLEERGSSRCPACAAPLAKGLGECPKCGLILAKYHVAEEPPPKGDSQRISLPDLLRGEAVKVDQRSPLIWVGALVGVVILVIVGTFLFFRSPSEAPRSSRKGPEPVLGTVRSESVAGQEDGTEATQTTKEPLAEGSATLHEGTTISRDSGDNPETAGSTSETAIAITPTESTLAEDEAAVPTAQKRSEQPGVDIEKTLDALGQSMIQDFDRAVQQWTSDDFKRFADRARQTLDRVSAEELSDEIRQTGENLILQLQMESPETAAEAFGQLVALTRPELNPLSRESKTRFIKAVLVIKQEIETSIRR